MTEQTQEPRDNAPGRSDEHIRQQVAAGESEILGIDNTDTALAPEDTGYSPDQEPEHLPAGKGSDPGLDDLPATD